MAPKLFVVLTSWALAVGAATAAIVATTPDSITGVYIPGWAHNTSPGVNYFDITEMNLDRVSHIYYAFLWIHDNNFTVYDPFGNLPRLTELKSRWPATKLLLSIGGGGFNTTIWSRAASIGLSAFVDSTMAAIRAANADGIDLDWEFPVADNRTTFTNLCATLRARLDAEGAAASPPRHYWLTAATQSIVYGDSFAGYDLPALKNTVDLFNIMTYTMHDPCYWETHTNFHTGWTECARALEYYIGQGVPASQLVLGLAFYGHVYTLTDPTQYTHPAPSVESRDCSTMTTVSYRGIMRDLQLYGGGVFTNATERSAYYVRGTRWIGFDIAETFGMKIQGSRGYGAGGVMIWDASLELPDGALLRSIATRQIPAVRSCGGGFVGSGQCADASQCCSEFGYCGINETFCGPRCRGGPCIQYPSPPPRPPAPPPNCGSGVVGSGICSDSNLCCSQYGWCWTGADFCGAGCQGGPCWYVPRSPPPPPSPPAKPLPPSPPPLPFGCGDGEVGNGSCPFSNQCCSMFGYCGDTIDHCGWGCRGGPCIAFPPMPPGPMCGGGNVGNGQCGIRGYCCSKYGYCGDTYDHCGPDCQGGACWFPPPAPNNTASPPPPSPKPPQPASKPPPTSSKPPPLRKPPPSPRPPRPPPPSPRPPSPARSPPIKPPPRPPPPRLSPSPPPSSRSPPKPPPSPRRSPPPKWPSPKPPSSPPPPSIEPGTCGNGNVGNRRCPDPSECCSAAGHCAISEDHCYWFCVGGACWDPPPPPRLSNVTYPPSPPPPAPGTVFCGGGVVGNGQCELKHLCCSAFGWCWYDADHCLGSNCLGGPCWAPPPGSTPPPPPANLTTTQP